jgi:hypothetical protein
MRRTRSTPSWPTGDHGLAIPLDAAPETDALKTERLRKAIEAGIADLERGNYEEVDDAELDAWLDRLVDAPHS